MRVFAFGVVFVLGSMAMAQRIAVVPPIHMAKTSERRLQVTQNQVAANWLTEQFTIRGFRVLNSNEIRGAFENLKIDPFKPDQFTASNLMALGSRLRADYVLITVLDSTRSRRVERAKFTDTVGEVTGRLWLFDVQRELPIHSALKFSGSKGGSPDNVDIEGQEVQVRAVEEGLRNGLRDFLRKFPERTAR